MKRRGRNAAPSFSMVLPNFIFVVSPTDNGDGIVHTVRRREDPASPWWLRCDKMVLPAKQNGGAL